MVLILAGFVVVVAPPLAWAFNFVSLSRVDRTRATARTASKVWGRSPLLLGRRSSLGMPRQLAVPRLRRRRPRPV